MGANFSSIELEVRSNSDLSKLANALEKEVGANFCGPAKDGGRWGYLFSGSFSGSYDDEAAPPNGPNESNPFEQGIDLKASFLCDLMDALAPEIKALWDSAGDRVFDVGLEANTNQIVIINFLSPETMSRMASLGVRLAVSVYALNLEHEMVRLKAQIK